MVFNSIRGDLDSYGRPRVRKHFDEEDPRAKSKTQQHYKAYCDVNSRIARAKKQNVIPSLPQRRDAPQYVDVSYVGDFHEAVNRVFDAYDQFMRLPADVRKRFDNNPANMVTFLQDGENLQEAVDLGLLPASVLPKPEPQPDPEPDPEPKPEPDPAAGQ